MLYKGEAKRLTDEDLPRAGALIGVGEDEIHAVLDVEASGSGYDSEGRVKMLFEPHIFYREIEGRERARAVEQGLAYKRWGARKYPRDSYPRLAAAAQINLEAAHRSASWGLGQIMGFNAGLCGYGSALEMVKAFAESEGNQLDAVVNFIKGSGLDDELRRHDWRGFAKGYNGPSYARHGYHRRLKARYEWWSRKPDTPWPPQPEKGVCECCGAELAA